MVEIPDELGQRRSDCHIVCCHGHRNGQGDSRGKEKISKPKERQLACAAVTQPTAARGEGAPTVWLCSQLVVLHLQQRERRALDVRSVDDNATRCRWEKNCVLGLACRGGIVSTNLQVVGQSCRWPCGLRSAVCALQVALKLRLSRRDRARTDQPQASHPFYTGPLTKKVNRIDKHATSGCPIFHMATNIFILFVCLHKKE